MKTKRFSVIFVVIIILLMLVSCSNKSESQKPTQTVAPTQTGDSTKPTEKPTVPVLTTPTEKEPEIKTNHIKEGSFVMDADGKILKNDDERLKDHKFIDWYFDPRCPYCTQLDNMLKEDLPKILKETDTFLRYHVLGFLTSGRIVDYSSKAATYLLGVAELAPEVYQKFVDKVMNAPFFPEGDTGRTDLEFKNVFLEVGGTEEQWARIVSNYEVIKETMDKYTEKVLSDEKITSKSTMNGFYVPFVIVNNAKEALSELDLDTILNEMRRALK